MVQKQKEMYECQLKAFSDAQRQKWTARGHLPFLEQIKLALHYYIKNNYYIQCNSTGVYKRVLLRLLTTTGSYQIILKLAYLSPTFFQ